MHTDDPKAGRADSTLLLTNIQRFSLHDGPGIRTTVFLKGCSLRCPWCSNPENREPHPESYIKDGIRGTWGIRMSRDALFDELLKDRAFYAGELEKESWNILSADDIPRLPGGVTFSGGEPLLQAPALVPLLIRLGEAGIHRCAETCLHVPEAYLREVISRFDFFYADIKILREDAVRTVLGGSLSLFLGNLRTLLSSGKPVVLRLPVIGGYTDSPENRLASKELIARMCAEEQPPLKLELIAEHHLGLEKFRALGLPDPPMSGVSASLMETYREELSELGIPVEICRI